MKNIVPCLYLIQTELGSRMEAERQGNTAGLLYRYNKDSPQAFTFLNDTAKNTPQVFHSKQIEN